MSYSDSGFHPRINCVNCLCSTFEWGQVEAQQQTKIVSNLWFTSLAKSAIIAIKLTCFCFSECLWMSLDLATKTLVIKRLWLQHLTIPSDLVSDAKQAITDGFISSRVDLISTSYSIESFNSSTTAATTESNSAPKCFAYLSDILGLQKLAKGHNMALVSSSLQRINLVQELKKIEKQLNLLIFLLRESFDWSQILGFRNFW